MNWQENHNGINPLEKKADGMICLTANGGKLFPVIAEFFPV